MSHTPPATQAPLVEGAGGVVFDSDGGVLVIRHRNGEWVFPKGHIEDDEDRLETAVREVAEEAGVPARCPEPGTTWTTEYTNPRGERRRITWFALETDEDHPTMREAQFPEGAFLEPDEAMNRLAFDEDRTLLRKVLSSRS